MIYAEILYLYDTIRNFIDCRLWQINRSISCDTFMFLKYSLIQFNYIRMYDFDNYDKASVAGKL